MFTGIYEKYTIGVILLLCSDNIQNHDIISTAIVLDVPSFIMKLYWFLCELCDNSISPFPTTLVILTHMISTALMLVGASVIIVNAFAYIDNFLLRGFLEFNILKIILFKMQNMSNCSQKLYLRKMYRHQGNHYHKSL